MHLGWRDRHDWGPEGRKGGVVPTGEGWGLLPEGWMVRRGVDVLPGRFQAEPLSSGARAGAGAARLPCFPGARVSFDWVCGSHLSGQSLRQRGTGFPAGQGSFQLGRKVSTCGDAPCSSQNHEPPWERKHRSCHSPRGEPSAGCLLLSAPPQGYLKGPWGAGGDPPGGGGGKEEGLALQGFASSSGKQGDSFGASLDFVCCY